MALPQIFKVNIFKVCFQVQGVIIRSIANVTFIKFIMHSIDMMLQIGFLSKISIAPIALEWMIFSNMF